MTRVTEASHPTLTRRLLAPCRVSGGLRMGDSCRASASSQGRIIDAVLMTTARISVDMGAEPVYVPHMPAALVTADELLRLNLPDKRTELVKGVLVVREPAGGRHGRVAMETARRLANHVQAHGLGRVYAAETGFTLFRNPDTVRAPDVAFVRNDRLVDPEPAGFFQIAPDLAVEVLSPGDRPGEVLAKVADWLSAGTKLVWVVDPERRLARVYRHDGSETLVDAHGKILGEAVVPGFSCRLDDILRI